MNKFVVSITYINGMYDHIEYETDFEKWALSSHIFDKIKEASIGIGIVRLGECVFKVDQLTSITVEDKE